MKLDIMVLDIMVLDIMVLNKVAKTPCQLDVSIKFYMRSKFTKMVFRKYPVNCHFYRKILHIKFIA